MKKESNGLTCLQAARLMNISKQAMFIAIRKNRVLAEKVNNKWIIQVPDLNNYINSKYEKRVEKSKDEYTIKEAARFLECNEQHLYHACRSCKIKCKKRNKYRWIIHIDDLNEYRQVMELGKRKSKVV